MHNYPGKTKLESSADMTGKKKKTFSQYANMVKSPDFNVEESSPQGLLEVCSGKKGLPPAPREAPVWASGSSMSGLSILLAGSDQM